MKLREYGVIKKNQRVICFLYGNFHTILLNPVRNTIVSVVFNEGTNQ